MRAARAGTVAVVRDGFTGHSAEPSWKNRTNTITVFHEDGTMAEYNNIRQHSARVKRGHKVWAGEVLTLSGNVGYS